MGVYLENPKQFTHVVSGKGFTMFIKRQEYE